MRKLFILCISLVVLFSCGNKHKKQLQTVSETTRPTWVENAVIYEVNVRQFTSEGTFEAFATHLPRLKELGVNVLWFMPIQSIGEEERKGTLGSYYSIKNYTEINPEFGTLGQFEQIVDKAHTLGMKVILDWVGNHTSRDAEWIHTHPEWYVTDSLGNILAPYDWTDVAKLNYANNDMRGAMIQKMLFWIREANIDGFRCDVAGEVPVDFWETAVDSIRAAKKDIFMLAEAENPILNEKAFDAFYAWDFHHKMNMVAQGKADVDSLRVSLKQMRERFPENAIPMFFTSNHDENSWNGTEFERMGDAAKTFAALTYFLPGIPLIYNGQEVGFNRRLAFFEKDEIDWNDTRNFTDFYHTLNTLKVNSQALSFSQKENSRIEELGNSASRKIWSFKRESANDSFVCIFNLSNETVQVTFDEQISGTTLENEIIKPTKELLLQPWEYKILKR